MIHSTRAITLVLISAASVLGGYATFEAARSNDNDQWSDGSPSTQPYSGHSSHYSHYSSYHSGGYYGSSGSRSSGYAHGTSRRGFGAHGHAGS